jgi:hypothetical protein
MYPTLVLSAALVAPAAPVPRDTAPNTTSPAPRVLALKADSGGAVRVIGTIPTKVTVANTFFVIENVVENGKQVQKQLQKTVEQDIVTSQYFDRSLADFNGKFATADGTSLTLDEATSRIKNGATVLASADGKPIAKSWLRTVSPDTIVMVAEGLSHAQVQWGGGDVLPNTPAPRLALYGTDESGKLLVPCTSQPLSVNHAYYDDFAFEGRAFRGRGIRQWDGYMPPSPTTPAVVNKPLADVKFDAYDVTGKLLSKTDAMKRLAAGGMVLVAGDNRMPDELYLKAFKDDVLVLVSPDLVLPVVPVDQTKKKKEPEKVVVVNVVAAVAPAPVVVAPAAAKDAEEKERKAKEQAEKEAKDKEIEQKKLKEKVIEEQKLKEKALEERKLKEKN